MRDWRRDHPPSAEARRRANARRYALVYVERGRLQRQPCAVCGASPATMHHDDFARPLAVTWLCHQHRIAGASP